jgi:hypothetical protein
VFIEMNFFYGVERGVIDTDAKSFWVEKTWLLGVGGTMMKFCGPGATGADERSLSVLGTGVLP